MRIGVNRYAKIPHRSITPKSTWRTIVDVADWNSRGLETEVEAWRSEDDAWRFDRSPEEQPLAEQGVLMFALMACAM